VRRTLAQWRRRLAVRLAPELVAQRRRALRRVGRLEARLADVTELARRDRDLYIALLQRALMHTLYRPLDVGTRSLRVQQTLTEEEARHHGRDWPIYAQTMLGARRLDNVRRCVETVLRRRVPGDLIEAGVWRGGATILMRGILAAYGDPPDRHVYVADSFCGLPAGDPSRYPADAPFANAPSPRPGGLDPSLLAVPRAEVARNFELYGLLDDRVRFLEGWFTDTLPTVRDRSWAVIRLDGDLYESTIDGLTNLYPGLSVGGFCIVDDYLSIRACRRAVDDYRAEHGITEPIRRVDWTAVYWRRQR
jgi:O-methyltransferase